VHHSYHHKITAEKIAKNRELFGLLDEVTEIVTDTHQAQKVFDGIKSKFEKCHFERLYHTFLCDSRDFEKPLYDFIVLGFKDQRHLHNIQHPSILYLENLWREYFRHLHKMYGFTRFEELKDGTLYAKIGGKFNLLPFLGRHFTKRLDGCRFIIHDLDRSLAYFKDENGGEIHQVADYDTPVFSENEAKFQKLWKTFFESVTIKERQNLKLQQNWVPLHYRKYMNEFT
jgi:probable DNA metabolism protein